MVLHHDGELKSGTRGLGSQASVHMVAIPEGSSSEKCHKSRELIEVQSAPPQLEVVKQRSTSWLKSILAQVKNQGLFSSVLTYLKMKGNNSESS